MTRATFIGTLVGGVVAFPSITSGETASEKVIYDLLDAAIDAQFTYDFPRLVTMLHSASLRLFRNQLSARFDQLLRFQRYPQNGE